EGTGVYEFELFLKMMDRKQQLSDKKEIENISSIRRYIWEESTILIANINTKTNNIMRKNIVTGNWKMNLDYEQGLSLFSEMINMIKDEVHGEQEVVICSPFIHLPALAK